MKKIFDITIPPNPIPQKDFQCYSKEEDIAWEIWISINRYYSKQKGYITSEFPKSILENFCFEILNKESIIGKNVLFSYVLKPDTNVKAVEIALMTIGIYKRFKYDANFDTKKYLAVWKVWYSGSI